MKQQNLQNTIKLNIAQAISFNNIINKSDKPYNFNSIKNYWWRWYSEIFGINYNRIKRTYNIWVTTFLKKNLNLKIPFFFSLKKNFSNPINNYSNYIFLYNLSTNNNIISFGKIKNNFNKLNKFNNLSESAKFILLPKNKFHRTIGSIGNHNWELNMFFSSYNSNWYSLYNKNSIFKLSNRVSKNFLMIINSFFISSSFFINTYDSDINIYPQYYLNYKHLAYRKFYYQKLFNPYYNLKLYQNLINNIYIKLLKKFNFLNVSYKINCNTINFINYQLVTKFNKIKNIYYYFTQNKIDLKKSNKIYKYLYLSNTFSLKKNFLIYLTYLVTKNIKFNNKNIKFNNKNIINKIYFYFNKSINCLKSKSIYIINKNYLINNFSIIYKTKWLLKNKNYNIKILKENKKIYLPLYFLKKKNYILNILKKNINYIFNYIYKQNFKYILDNTNIYNLKKNLLLIYIYIIKYNKLIKNNSIRFSPQYKNFIKLLIKLKKNYFISI